jgi:hypothetical protein
VEHTTKKAMERQCAARRINGIMSGLRIVALLLIVGGVAALVFGRFSYTSETHDAKIGPLEFSVQEKETVNIPDWVGAAAIAGGVLVLVLGGRK